MKIYCQKDSSRGVHSCWVSKADWPAAHWLAGFVSTAVHVWLVHRWTSPHTSWTCLIRPCLYWTGSKGLVMLKFFILKSIKVKLYCLWQYVAGLIQKLAWMFALKNKMQEWHEVFCLWWQRVLPYFSIESELLFSTGDTHPKSSLPVRCNSPLMDWFGPQC